MAFQEEICLNRRSDEKQEKLDDCMDDENCIAEVEEWYAAAKAQCLLSCEEKALFKKRTKI